eukprot:9326996-Pyramimonas_sp.AAC.1
MLLLERVVPLPSPRENPKTENPLENPHRLKTEGPRSAGRSRRAPARAACAITFVVFSRSNCCVGWRRAGGQ